MLYHTYSPPSLLPGDGGVAVSCLSVPHLRSGIYKLYWSQQVLISRWLYTAAGSTHCDPARFTIYPCTYGCTFDSQATELMAESVYGGDIQSIITDH